MSCQKVYQRKHSPSKKNKGDLCGKPTSGGPYCPLHSWMDYQKSLREEAKERHSKIKCQTRSLKSLQENQTDSTNFVGSSNVEILIKKL